MSMQDLIDDLAHGIPCDLGSCDGQARWTVTMHDCLSAGHEIHLIVCATHHAALVKDAFLAAVFRRRMVCGARATRTESTLWGMAPLEVATRQELAAAWVTLPVSAL